jgi:acyl transferase domain-containing protein/acyl carrier protein
LEYKLSGLKIDLIREWLVKELSERLSVAREEIDAHRPFADYGLSSREAVVLLGDFERFLGRPLSPTLIYEYPTINAILAYLAAPEPSVLGQNSTRRKEHTDQEPIAIIGMGCRFPQAESPAVFWQLLLNKVDIIGEVPANRWGRGGFSAPSSVHASKMITLNGGFLSEVDQFDPEFFGIAPREAVSMDPQQRLLLEVAWEALERAGQRPDSLAGSSTGVFVGISNSDYAQFHLRSGDYERIDAYAGTGSAASVGVGRLSYILGLQGPNMAIDTACSSSLVAVHVACRSLRNGECDMALAGGVNLILSPEISIFLTQTHALSPDGRCKTFSADADGYGRGEGCGIVVLKRLSAAQADGDPILTIVRGSALNHDGHSNGLTVPNGTAQRNLLRAALEDAQVKPEMVDYIETHGTGTSLGDPIEVRALADVMGEGHSFETPLILGAVKANIGHLESAAGIAGLIKTVLTLQHGLIPAQLHFTEPNPYISWDSMPVAIATQTISWPNRSKPRIAGVSSFGFSGTNAHVILEEAPQVESMPVAMERPLHIMAFSGKREQDLHQAADDIRRFLETADNPSLADICYSVNVGRASFLHRLAVVAGSTAELQAKLEAYLHRNRSIGIAAGHSAQPSVAFMFSGQGSQYAGMARELYETQPTFRHILDECAAILEPYMARPLLQVLFADRDEAALINETAYTQPALFALEYALAALWQSWGVRPNLLLGHSVGEIVAATVAGVFTLEDGLKLVAIRGRLIQALSVPGQMVAIRGNEAQVDFALDGYREQVSIAAVNGPQNVVISGAADAISAVMERLETAGIDCIQLNVSHAFHSPLMNPILASFTEAVDTISYYPPQIPIISNIIGGMVLGDEMSQPQYWVQHILEPVRFAAGIETALTTKSRIFLEIGPGATLAALGSQVAAPDSALWLPSLRQGQPDWDQLLESLSALYVNGVEIDWVGFDRDYQRKRLDTPTYPFQRKRYWIEDSRSKHKNPATNVTGEIGFLGMPLHSPATDAVIFESDLEAGQLPFHEHQIYGTVLVPASGHIALLLSAAVTLYGSKLITLRDVIFRQALILPADEAVKMQVVLTPGEGSGEVESAAFQIYSAPSGRTADRSTWILHVTGSMDIENRRQSEIEPILDLKRSQTATEPGRGSDSIYQMMIQQGFALGRGFQWLEESWPEQEAAFGRLRQPEYTDKAERYVLHPGLIDSFFQLIGAAVPAADMDDTAFVPVSLENFTFFQPPEGVLWAYAGLRTDSTAVSDAFVGDLQLFNGQGMLIAQAKGLHVRRAARDLLLRASHPPSTNDMFEMAWQETAMTPLVSDEPLPKVGTWLVFGHDDPLSQNFTEQMTNWGADSILILPGQGFNRLSDGRYEIRADCPEDYQRVLHEVSQGGRQVAGILYMWSLTVEESLPQYTDDPLKTADQIGRSVLPIIQAIAELDNPPRLWLVSRAAQPVTTDTMLNVGQTLLWGMGRTIALELPQMWGGLIDLDHQPAANEAEWILAEIRGKDVEDQVAYRNGHRYVARLQSVQKAQHTQPISFGLRPNALYLITGGFGGLGANFAEWLAANGAGHVALLGRRDVDQADDGLVSTLEKAGACVYAFSADVSNRDELAAVFSAIDATGLPLSGIIHAAGILRDGVLQNLSWDDFASVLAAKVAGGWLLHEMTRNRELDFLVFCSSVVAVMGSPGQGNYAAANSFLDGLAHYRRAQGLPALSINWGPWADSGMAASRQNGHRQKPMMIDAFQPIEASEALAWLEGALELSTPQLAYAPVEWQALFSYAPYLRNQAALSNFSRQTVSPPMPTFSGSRLLNLSETLARLPSGERRDFLFDFTRQQVAAVLHIEALDSIGAEQPLNAMGMDSLMALDLTRLLSEAAGQTLSPTLLFNHATVDALTSYLAGLLDVHPEVPPAVQEANSEADQWAQNTLTEIRGLSDEELTLLLESELSELLDGN